MEVEHKAPSKLIVHNIYEVNAEDLIFDAMSSSAQMPLFWCDGYLFTIVAIDLNGKVLNDFLNGIVHWEEVTYCKFPKFQKEIDGSNGVYKFRVLDATNYHPHKDFIKWLKDKSNNKDEINK